MVGGWGRGCSVGEKPRDIRVGRIHPPCQASWISFETGNLYLALDSATSLGTSSHKSHSFLDKLPPSPSSLLPSLPPFLRQHPQASLEFLDSDSLPAPACQEDGKR